MCFAGKGNDILLQKPRGQSGWWAIVCGVTGESSTTWQLKNSGVCIYKFAIKDFSVCIVYK